MILSRLLPQWQRESMENGMPNDGLNRSSYVSRRGYKTELDLNNGQRRLCLKSASTARFAYNWGLAQNKQALKNKQKLPSALDLHKKLGSC